MTGLPNPEESKRLDVTTYPVVLSDGNAWGFAQPSIRLRPKIVAERDEQGRSVETVVAQVVVRYPPPIQRLLDATCSAIEDGPSGSGKESFLALAAALLQRGHEIDSPTAATLLASGDDDLPRLATEVFSIALGGRLSASPQTRANVSTEVHSS